MESEKISVYGYDQPLLLTERIVSRIAKHWKAGTRVALILAHNDHRRRFEIALNLEGQPDNYRNLLFISPMIQNPHTFDEIIYEDIDSGISQQRFNCMRLMGEGLRVSIYVSKKSIKEAFSRNTKKIQLRKLLLQANSESGANVDFREWYKNN